MPAVCKVCGNHQVRGYQRGSTHLRTGSCLKPPREKRPWAWHGTRSRLQGVVSATGFARGCRSRRQRRSVGVSHEKECLWWSAVRMLLCATQSENFTCHFHTSRFSSSTVVRLSCANSDITPILHHVLFRAVSVIACMPSNLVSSLVIRGSTFLVLPFDSDQFKRFLNFFFLCLSSRIGVDVAVSGFFW